MGKLDWKNLARPIVALSPMADMTDSAFCRVVRECSPGAQPVMFREMVSSEAVVRGNEKTLGMTDIHTEERPLVQQLFGSDPTTMAEATRIIDAEHAPDAFDVNMGCPVYKITCNFNGAALMKEPKRAADIVRAMKAVTTKPVSVKIRLGWSDPNDCLEFCRVLEDAGADLLTVHGRTKAQGYSGVSDWAQIAEVKKRISIPVLANGDIHSPALVPSALAKTGCDGTLIARGALGNPWFFSRAADALAGREPAPISLEERVRMIKRHLDLHVEQYGEGGVRTFRKHLSWYLKGLRDVKRFREQLVRVESKTALYGLLDELIAANVQDAGSATPFAARLSSATTL